MMPAYFYTVFGRRFEPAIRCAIAQSKPIPEFIQAADWEFVGTVRPSESPPVGFRHARAEEATRFVGFFVFHSETVACREQPETGSALHAPHARHLGAMPAQHGHAALPDPPTPASVLTLVQGIERHDPISPAALAFRSALFRAGMEADAAGGMAALVALVDAVAAADPARAETRTAILCAAWADLLPGPNG